MQHEIIERNITPVSVWNREQLAKQQYTLVYTLGNGSMIDTPRQRGWVVQKRHKQGGEKSRFYLNRQKAQDYFINDIF